MQRYKLITWQEWKKIEEQQELIRRSPHYFNSKVELSPPNGGSVSRVKHFYDSDYYPIIDYCIKHPEYCVDFYSTLQKFGLSYSSYYRGMEDKVRKVFFEALANHKIVILRLPTPVAYVEPKTRIEPVVSQPQPMMTKPIRKWDDDNEQFIEIEPNWIQLDLRSHPRHPYTILNPANGKIINSGRLDSGGYIDIDLPLGIDKVDIYMGEYREWEKDKLLQINTAAYQATNEFLDSLYEYTKLAPELTQQQHQILVDNINHLHDPKKYPDTPKAVVTSRSFLQGVYHFLVSYLQALNSVSFIYPIDEMGQVARNQVAGCIHADLMGTLRQSPLNNRALEDYFKAPINDNAAYERFKQATKNEDLGELVKVFHPLMRSVKYACIKPFFKQVKTRGRYDLRIKPLEVEPTEAKQRNWIELEFEPNASYSISEADSPGIPGYYLHHGVLDGNGFARVEIPLEFSDVEYFDIVYKAAEQPWYQQHWQRIMGGLQAAGGAATIVFAAGIAATGIGAPIAVGLAMVGADNLAAGTNSMMTNQATKTLGAQGLEFVGVSEQYSEMAYAVFDLAGTSKAIQITLNTGSLKAMQISFSKIVQGQIDELRFLKAKVNQWYGVKPKELKITSIVDNISSVKPKVIAELEVNGVKFVDTNQTARAIDKANSNKATLIANRIIMKEQQLGRELPNSNMANAHAEIGTLQQAFEAKVTKGANMKLTVKGEDVCGYCKGDIAAFAEAAEANSLIIIAPNKITTSIKTYKWESGMKTIKEIK